MDCADTEPGWIAAGAGRAAPGVTASVSATMPVDVAAAAAAAAGGQTFLMVKRLSWGQRFC